MDTRPKPVPTGDIPALLEKACATQPQLAHAALTVTQVTRVLETQRVTEYPEHFLNTQLVRNALENAWHKREVNEADGLTAGTVLVDGARGGMPKWLYSRQAPVPRFDPELALEIAELPEPRPAPPPSRSYVRRESPPASPDTPVAQAVTVTPEKLSVLTSLIQGLVDDAVTALIAENASLREQIRKLEARDAERKAKLDTLAKTLKSLR